ncbi:hypothetical protein HYALB_00013498 [Hymenoscyphus albidus]|uniref:Uncharacterized protein n=1 Tax=Hymenoscyphus albidus TaxID=595503 RepID=A0A9N9LW90_9HELO|nr:hypothetical protein HYALB_00013498 [Hymenoscyphus albidus]
MVMLFIYSSNIERLGTFEADCCLLLIIEISIQMRPLVSLLGLGFGGSTDASIMLLATSTPTPRGQQTCARHANGVVDGGTTSTQQYRVQWYFVSQKGAAPAPLAIAAMAGIRCEVTQCVHAREVSFALNEPTNQ